MADAYWSYGGARYQALAAPAPVPAPVKRPRTVYGGQDTRRNHSRNMTSSRTLQLSSDLVHLPLAHLSAQVPGGPELGGYYPHDEERVVHRGGRENEALGASYDQYVRNGPVSSYGGSESARSGLVEMPRHPIDDGRMMGVRGTDGRTADYGGGRREKSLPPDASSTLFVEGLPANCTRREVSHVFRPFPGFREVRLVNKESRHAGGDPWVLCFIDFSTPSQAAVALDCLQGYKFDEHDQDSPSLRLQFSRFPGPRSAGGPRGRR